MQKKKSFDIISKLLYGKEYKLYVKKFFPMLLFYIESDFT
ncbi:hypothetical protein C621_0230260 [Bacillus thuringiensis serovar aizawai str. Leapi01]|nr:hypothetical protein C621_0230260 [Bacillus thuringiensis serovar aizawai str. Leapi01]ETE94935.1 hypothetical protein C623_0223260 [Bacillus thuringiensis serovar aizawai str. Hu4-2]KLA28789.1 hypothetical protein B4158_2104 [Bacillus cereus]